MVSPSSSKASSPAVDVKKEILGEIKVVAEVEQEKRKKGKEGKKEKESVKEVVVEEEDDDECKQLFVGNVRLFLFTLKIEFLS